MNAELNKYILILRYWYDERDNRERLLIVILTWAILYFLFYYVISGNMDLRRANLTAEITQKEKDISNAKRQMAIINDITKSDLYKKWLATQKTQQTISLEHASLLNVAPKAQWQAIFNVILQSQPNVMLLHIQNLPETEYNPLNVPNLKNKIYAQSLVMTIESDYLDLMNYLNLLEKQLPMVHWDKLTYQVIDYPVAKIEMEFSILYEKPVA